MIENEKDVVSQQSQDSTPKKETKKFTLKLLGLVLTLTAVFFMLLGGFIYICGGSVGVLAMTGIATMLNIFALISIIGHFIVEKQVKFDAVHIVIALSLLANILTLF